jgi:hypothetical protein
MSERAERLNRCGKRSRSEKVVREHRQAVRAVSSWEPTLSVPSAYPKMIQYERSRRCISLLARVADPQYRGRASIEQGGSGSHGRANVQPEPAATYPARGVGTREISRMILYSRRVQGCISGDRPVDGLRSTHSLRSDGGPGKEAIPELFEALNFF